MRYSGFLNRGDAFQTGVTTSFTLGERNVIAGLEHGWQALHLAYQDAGIPGVRFILGK